MKNEGNTFSPGNKLKRKCGSKPDGNGQSCRIKPKMVVLTVLLNKLFSFGQFLVVNLLGLLMDRIGKLRRDDRMSRFPRRISG